MYLAFCRNFPRIFPVQRLAAFMALLGVAVVTTLAALTSIRAAGAETVAQNDEKTATSIDFNRDIRPILSNNCLTCHGPDANTRKAKLRLDTFEGATAARKGQAAITPGDPSRSGLIARVKSTDPDEVMPPDETGKKLSAREISLLESWIHEGAPYAQHWAYVMPTRPALPTVVDGDWPRNAIDQMVLAKLEKLGLSPSAQADRRALARRVALDLVGLPPTPDEVEAFVNDPAPDAYERYVDRLLDHPAYGEHWAHRWLDLARYADSAGYADDPPRTIWAYRDYVIRSFNENKPFDQFTIEQIAGDLLVDPTPDQLIATAFHRNTQTNSEGGTDDEEFRNVAVVDRVNTTMETWMGTTMACAQCHDHKYDPLSQEEYFQLFAIFNSTEDADRRDEAPVMNVWSEEQREERAGWEREIADLERTISTPTPELLEAQAQWEEQFQRPEKWQTATVAQSTSREGAKASQLEDQSLLFTSAAPMDVYTLNIPLDATTLRAIRVETLPHDSLPGGGAGHAKGDSGDRAGDFVVTRIAASLVPPDSQRMRGRYVRITIPGKEKMVSLAEVQVFDGDTNIATSGQARQSSTAYNGPAELAIDDNTNGDYQAGSVTHTAVSDDPWWEVDLKSTQAIDRIVLWNRLDNNLHVRLKDFDIAILDDQHQPIWSTRINDAPNPSGEYQPAGPQNIPLATAVADSAAPGFDAKNVLDIPAKVDDKQDAPPNQTGWSVGANHDGPHHLTVIPHAPIDAADGAVLKLTVEQLSPKPHHTLGRLRIALSDDPQVAARAQWAASLIQALDTPEPERSEAQRAELTKHYLTLAPQLDGARERLAIVRAQLKDQTPLTTVPVLRELPPDAMRTTHIQRRGNYLDKSDLVKPGVPGALHPVQAEAPIDRMTLARWLIDADNPLTARVIANRYWEAMFGLGLVRTSEEFGMQGELPTHPELLDWLAMELVDSGWDLKHLLRLIVTSATYRQDSRVTPAMLERDPDNELLARGPRFRLPAEAIRDQALFVSGLLSDKMFGPPVNPPKPSSGLNAAFGGGIDWKTSTGEDRYRRAIYTTWRRSSPYPSMSTFDAPSREICTVRRDRTNTPLQALVTLNDPVYIEAAQALARRLVAQGDTQAARIDLAFESCLARPATDQERDRLLALYERAYDLYSQDHEAATKMATDPLGEAPPESNIAELAAWTVVANVTLNLDEFLMKR